MPACSRVGRRGLPRRPQRAAAAGLWSNRVSLWWQIPPEVRGDRREDGAAGQQGWLPAGRSGIAPLRSPGCLAVGMAGLTAPASAWDGGPRDGPASTAGMSFLQKPLEDRAQDVSHGMTSPIARFIPSSPRHSPNGLSPGAGSLDSGHGALPSATLLQLPAPSKRLRKDVSASGPWQTLSIKFFFRVFSRFVTVSEGINPGTHTPSQQDTN